MKFIKLIRTDFLESICSLRRFIPVLCLLSLLGVKAVYSIRMVCNEGGTLGDYLMICMQGSIPFFLSGEQYFHFPTEWVLWMIGCCTFCLSYPFESLYGIELQMFIKSEHRRLWWLSKCICCAFQVVFYYLMLIIFLGIVSVAKNNGCTFALSQKFISSFFSESEFLFLPTAGHATSVQKAILLSALSSTSICVLQFFLSVVLNPVLGFCISVSIISISSIWFSPVAFANYAMIIRSNLFLYEGLPVRIGTIICISIIFFSVVLGMIYVDRWDIIPSKGER